MPRASSKKAATGPKPETIRADGADWKDAMRHAMNKPKPQEGWPKPEPKKKPKSR